MYPAELPDHALDAAIKALEIALLFPYAPQHYAASCVSEHLHRHASAHASTAYVGRALRTPADVDTSRDAYADDTLDPHALIAQWRLECASLPCHGTPYWTLRPPPLWVELITPVLVVPIPGQLFLSDWGDKYRAHPFFGERVWLNDLRRPCASVPYGDGSKYTPIGPLLTRFHI